MTPSSPMPSGKSRLIESIPMDQESITYSDIESNFPLEGKYIFRFKFKHSQKVVWLDLQSQRKSKSLPTYEGKIFVKATRISWKSEESTFRPKIETEKPEKKSSSSTVHNKEDPIDLMNHSHPTPNQKEKKPQTSNGDMADLLGGNVFSNSNNQNGGGGISNDLIDLI